MKCSVRTCAHQQDRKGAKVQPTLCLGHVWLWVYRHHAAETLEEFVKRHESLDLLRGRTMRREVAQ